MSDLIPMTVEIAPLGTVADLLTGTALEWADVSGWVRLADGINFSRGRTGETGAMSAGSLGVTFGCDPRYPAAFTSGRPADTLAMLIAAAGGFLAAEAKWPGITLSEPALKDRPIRVSALYDDDPALPMWTGVITEQVASWANGMLPLARITAADPVAALARLELHALPVQVALSGVGSCRWLYPLTETAGDCADVAGDRAARPLAVKACGFPLEGVTLTLGAGGSPGSNAGGDEQGTPVWVGGDDENGWKLDTGNRPLADMPDVGPYDAAGGGASFHAMFWPSADGVGRTRVVFALHGWNAQLVSVYLTAANEVCAVIWDGITTTTLEGPQVTSGVWHHVAVVCTDQTITTDVALYVDGAGEDTATDLASLYRIGGRRIVVGASVTSGEPWEGSIANVAAHDRVLTATDVARLALGAAGYTGETTTTRVGRLMYAAGWPLAASISPVGLSTMCPQHTAGRTLADALDECAAAELAPWWITPEGTVTATSRAARYWRMDSATVPAKAVDGATEFQLDDAGRVNVATVSRPGGVRITRRRADGGALSTFESNVTLMLDSDAQVEAIADAAIADRYAIPEAKSPTVSIDPVTAGASLDVAAVLALDVDDVFEVTGLPASAPAATLRLLITGITDRPGPAGWPRIFNVVPAPPITDVARWNVTDWDSTIEGWAL